jgi:hypothetical protein
MTILVLKLNCSGNCILHHKRDCVTIVHPCSAQRFYVAPRIDQLPVTCSFTMVTSGREGSSLLSSFHGCTIGRSDVFDIDIVSFFVPRQEMRAHV